MPRYETKPCAAHSCTEQIKRRLLMCPRHWRMVPRDIQDRVLNTLDAWQHGGSAKGYVHAVAEAQLAVAIKDNLSADVIAALTADAVRIFLAQQISPAMKALAREGQREYRERMSPYLRRMYTDIFANQVWVGDTAILDVEAANDIFPELPDHAPLRLRLTAFEDFRSRKIVGVTFGDASR